MSTRTRAIVVLTAVVVTAAIAAFAVYKGRHVAMEAAGEWYCMEEFCGTGFCQKCRTQTLAMCFSASSVLRGDDFEVCYATPSACERGRRQALDDLDIEGVGGCRVVSALADDRQAYGECVIAVWISAAVLALLSIVVAWKVGGMAGKLFAGGAALSAVGAVAIVAHRIPFLGAVGFGLVCVATLALGALTSLRRRER